MLLLTSVFAVVGCGSDDDGPAVEYNITVLSPDGSPLKGVTVLWQKSGATAGTAATGDDGVASVTIAEGTYNVVIDGLDEGLTYPEITVTPDVRMGISVKLSIAVITYTVEVKDKTGAAAKGVTVTWSDGSTIAGTATTGDDGRASCDLSYGEYSVTVSDLPDGNVFTESKTVTAQQPHAAIELIDGQAVSYSVSVRSEGGLKFADVMVFVYSGNRPVYTGKTDENGVLNFMLPGGNYTADVPNVQDGYKVSKAATLTAAVHQSEIELSSSVILDPPASVKAYKIGDIIHDYEFTTPYEVEGSKVTYSISELLETKDAVIINNWGTQCSACVMEVAAMQEAYEKYQDRIELIAVSNYISVYGYDTDSDVINFREDYELTFPMMCDKNSFNARFSISGHPTTIVVDRYGAIAHIEVGAISSAEVWERLIVRYLGDNYVQTFVPGKDNEPITSEVAKPDITVSEDHYQKIGEAINNFDESDDVYIKWSGETENEYMWPFILKTEEGISDEEQVLCSSNAKKPNSMSALYGLVKMPVGKVFTFDYYAECETDADILSIIWDGKIIRQISGLSKGWKTCHLYVELTTGEHRLAFAYKKDTTTDIGRDNVYIRNIRFEDISTMTESTDMMRSAAYGIPEENAEKFPYYADVELASDGYYHVKLDDLQNSGYAGVDKSPMLFANLTNVTNWNNLMSMSTMVYAVGEETNEYLYDFRLTIDGKTRDYRQDMINYCQVASASDISGLVPVDKQLGDILSAFTAKAMGDKAHDDAWLEFCYFYSHYGDGEYIGNPIMGLTPKTALPVALDTEITAHLTKPTAPFPTLIYSFTPQESAVYKIESLLPAGNVDAQMWLYDDQSTVNEPILHSGEDRFNRDGKNEQNFVVLRYMEAGQKYYIEVALLMNELGDLKFKVTKAGQSATELVSCSDGVFNIITDANNNVLGIELAGAIEYVKDNDGYYHAKNEDGSMGGFIYLDVKYPTRVTTTMSLSQLAEQKLKVPYKNEYCKFGVFDFRYTIAYFDETTAEGTVTNYDPEFDLTEHGIDGREYKDYTDIIKGYIAGADDGLVKVNDEIVTMLGLFIETRINSINNYEYEPALENEWLRFCWYDKNHDQNNP